MARKRRGELSTAAFRDEAYRGYLIRQSPINEAIWVEKDGFMIGHAKSKDDARHIIEELTVKTNPRKRRPNPTTGGNINVQHFERWNRGGRHKWITKAIAAKLPRIGTTSELPPEKVRVALKLFNPGGAGSWFITEANLDTGEAFGYVTGLGDDELGYMDLNEMRAFKGRFGLPLERDEHFSGTLAEVMDGKKNPKARDPAHRKLLKRLDTHFATDERAMKKNPGAWVIASTLHNGTALTFDGSNRFTDSRKPNLYRTRVAAQDKLALLRKHFKGNDTLNRAFVREAQGDEAGAVFGARPRQRNPGKREPVYEVVDATGIVAVDKYRKTPKLSEYTYGGFDKESGLHRFYDGDKLELFGRSKQRGSGWRLKKGAYYFEFVRSPKP